MVREIVFDTETTGFNYDKGDRLIEIGAVELINEFGDEEIIYEALLNTPIVSVSNVYEYLKDDNLLDESDTIVEEGDLRRSSGVFHSKPEISYNVDGTYKIDDIKRVVAVVNFDFNNNSSKGTLIHELCHLVKFI